MSRTVSSNLKSRPSLNVRVRGEQLVDEALDEVRVEPVAPQGHRVLPDAELVRASLVRDVRGRFTKRRGVDRPPGECPIDLGKSPVPQHI